MNNVTLAPSDSCQECLKPLRLCFCNKKLSLTTNLKIVILQHPQEPKELLSTAPLLKSALATCSVKVGLSWPNFKKAIEPLVQMPNQWAVVYLGSGVKVPEGVSKKITHAETLVFVDKKGYCRNAKETEILKKQIKGIIFLDGTWSQAKTLWWRNPWLTKLTRIVLNPKSPSIYGKLRKEPKRECLSTLESVSEVLSGFGETEPAEKLRENFKHFLSLI